MSDEIKEIKINKEAKSITFINNGIAFSQFGIANEILDLITNLQEELEEEKRIEQADFKIIQNLEEENERFKNDIEDISISHFSLFKRYEDYKSRNEKAIEYINDNSHYYSTDTHEVGFVIDTEDEEFCNSLLNILTGGDKE